MGGYSRTKYDASYGSLGLRFDPYHPIWFTLWAGVVKTKLEPAVLQMDEWCGHESIADNDGHEHEHRHRHRDVETQTQTQTETQGQGQGQRQTTHH